MSESAPTPTITVTEPERVYDAQPKSLPAMTHKSYLSLVFFTTAWLPFVFKCAATKTSMLNLACMSPASSRATTTRAATLNQTVTSITISAELLAPRTANERVPQAATLPGYMCRRIRRLPAASCRAETHRWSSQRRIVVFPVNNPPLWCLSDQESCSVEIRFDNLSSHSPFDSNYALLNSTKAALIMQMFPRYAETTKHGIPRLKICSWELPLLLWTSNKHAIQERQPHQSLKKEHIPTPLEVFRHKHRPFAKNRYHDTSHGLNSSRIIQTPESQKTRLCTNKFPYPLTSKRGTATI
ncbi:uncharacterized protein TRIREDRAFT_107973 [Trichoderma reesei QM6a]|uniref:Predicted protein n=1 Tax=Hypocrea jecorina (strain QM6a) TaxID=431241 RepID=G0RK53_HYPJQ|nr:uncharacterized protein TRIREDRAFT_107973 [Trichoderma reesei QM6a]EGR48485.1 predicted protein [Trichoderma reesei QM6a]